MKKKSLFLTTILTVSLFMALLWEVKNHPERMKTTGTPPHPSVTQAIHLVVTNEGLTVKQIFSDLEEKQYKAVPPMNAALVTCEDADGIPCRKAEMPHTYFADHGMLQFNFRIDRSTDKVINDWMMQLTGTHVSKTKIELIDRMDYKGTWIAGLPLKGRERLELVDYYVFEGKLPNPSLFYHKGELHPVQKQKGITYYSKEKVSPILQDDIVKDLGEKGHLSIVLSSDVLKAKGKGLLIINRDMNKDELEKEIVAGFLLMNLSSLSKDERWIVDTLASLITSSAPSTKKGRELTEELERKLTPAQLSDFITSLKKGSSLHTHEQLDAQLGKIRGLDTTFFSKNRKSDTPISPLNFTDDRQVVINGREVNDFNIMIQDGESLYPFLRTMNAMGFEAKHDSSKGNVEVTTAKKRYLFHVRKNIFEVNGRKYGLLENPFVIQEGILYIEEELLKIIFGISIIEREREILLSA